MRSTQQLSAVGRESRTDYVVLATLQFGPATGYGIRKRIKSTVGNFWQESFGQLYPALRDLTSRRLLRSRSVSVGRRAAEEFSITTRGTRVLRDWVCREPRVEPERNELLLKLHLAELAPSAVVSHVQAVRARAAVEQARLEGLLEEIAKDYADDSSLPAWCATVDYGIALQVALIAWSDRTLKRLKALVASDSKVRPEPGSIRLKKARSRL
ncbi:MAG: PadR family transcriptional regulator [Myxococcales bacterium]